MCLEGEVLNPDPAGRISLVLEEKDRGRVREGSLKHQIRLAVHNRGNLVSWLLVQLGSPCVEGVVDIIGAIV